MNTCWYKEDIKVLALFVSMLSLRQSVPIGGTAKDTFPTSPLPLPLRRFLGFRLIFIHTIYVRHAIVVFGGDYGGGDCGGDGGGGDRESTNKCRINCNYRTT